MVYYGLSLASPSLGSNVYVSYSLSASMEILAAVYCAVAMDTRLGRGWSLRIVLLLGGAALLLTLAVPKGCESDTVIHFYNKPKKICSFLSYTTDIVIYSKPKTFY